MYKTNYKNRYSTMSYYDKIQEYERRKKDLQRQMDKEGWSHDKYDEEIQKVAEEVGI